METQAKKKIMPESVFAWLIRSQERKRELQEQFQKDCESGRIKELLKDAKPAF